MQNKLTPNEIITHAQVLLTMLRKAHKLMSDRPKDASEVDAGLLLEEVRNTVVRTLGLPEYSQPKITGIMPSEMLVMLEDCIERATTVAESAFYANHGDAAEGKETAEAIFESVAATVNALLCTPRFDPQRMFDIALVYRPSGKEETHGFSDPDVSLRN